jgi:hypothetical protein
MPFPLWGAYFAGALLAGAWTGVFAVLLYRRLTHRRWGKRRLWSVATVEVGNHMDEIDAYLSSELRNPDFKAWYKHIRSGPCLTCKRWSTLPLIGKRITDAHSRKVRGEGGNAP